ncbi:MAG: pyruvate kinase, partial [Bacteroidota bacterium]
MPEIKIKEFVQALSLAAEKHKFQRRAGYDALPYINHLIKVSQILIEVADEKDRNILLAGLLHDILEDTDITREELIADFGEEVASIVEELTDDMSLDYEKRKQLQLEGAKQLSEAARKIRITDKSTNLKDIFEYPLNWSLEEKQAYQEMAAKIVDQLRGTDEALEQYFDDSLNYVQKLASEVGEENKATKLDKMIAKIERLIKACKKAEEKAFDPLSEIHPRYTESARNLIYYREFRQYDLRKLQESLGSFGLSRLAKAQAHILAGLKNTRTILKALRDGRPIREDKLELSFKKGSKLLRSNAKKLLGKAVRGRSTRIMVTMPTEAATNYELVHKMVKEGMDVARINCAHDNEEVWGKIIENVRKAAESQKKVCKIAMDLAGPKIRTGQLKSGPQVRKYRPIKDEHGKIDQALEIWIGPKAKKKLAHLPIRQEDVAFFKDAEEISFLDTRGKKRKFRIDKWTEEGIKAFLDKTAFLETGSQLFRLAKREGDSISVGEMPYKEGAIILQTGDQLRLEKESLPGSPALLNKKGALIKPAHISCTAPAVFDQVKVGEKILFDDGKIEGLIEEVHPDHLWIKITYAAEGGGKLKEDKGINLPDSNLNIKGLTDKDRKDLPFVATH